MTTETCLGYSELEYVDGKAQVSVFVLGQPGMMGTRLNMGVGEFLDQQRNYWEHAKRLYKKGFWDVCWKRRLKRDLQKT